MTRRSSLSRFLESGGRRRYEWNFRRVAVLSLHPGF